MGKLASVIILALIAGAYATLCTGANILLILFSVGFLIFWLVVKPVKKEKEKEDPLKDLKERVEALEDKE